MSRLGSELSAILAALVAGEVRVATGGKLTAPCVLVEGGDPWSERERLSPDGRVGRWRLTAVAGAVDTDGALEELAELVDKVDAALLAGLGGAQLPAWARPSAVELGDGIRRLATISTIQYASS